MDVDVILAVAGIVGFAASEIIALVPQWKSNSVLQLIVAIMKRIGKR